MTRPVLGKNNNNPELVVIFLATTPFAINSFLANHLFQLAKDYRIILCTNLEVYALMPKISDTVEVHHVPFARKISLFSDIKSLLVLLFLMFKTKPMVVHSITPKAGLLGMLAAFILRVPFRWHTFTGQIWANKRGLSRIFLKSFDELIVILSSKVLADSSSQCTFLFQEKVVRPGGITVLGKGSIAGVNLDRFKSSHTKKARQRSLQNTKSHVCVFLFIGRLTEDKGVFNLMEAFKLLALEIQNIELWVVGPDDQGLLKSLQEMGKGCKEPIYWFDATSTPEDFIVGADVLLLPSYREGFGSVIIEAAACGVPAIAYNIYGVIDAVTDGKNGVLIEKGQLGAFKEAMKSLALDSELRLRLGVEARKYAINNFSDREVTRAWVDFYRKHLN